MPEFTIGSEPASPTTGSRVGAACTACCTSACAWCAGTRKPAKHSRRSSVVSLDSNAQDEEEDFVIIQFNYGEYVQKKLAESGLCPCLRAPARVGPDELVGVDALDDDGLDEMGRPVKVVYTFNPDSQWKSFWDWVIVLYVILNVMAVPMGLAFQPKVMSTTVFNAFDTFVDLCFFFDILVTFNTAVPSTWGKLEHDHRIIATKYARGLLIVDIAAVFPFSLVVSAFGAEWDGQALGMFKLFRLLRIGRLMKKLDQLAAANAFRVIKLLFGFLLLAHLLGCMWYFLGTQLLECVQDPTCDTHLQEENLWISVYVLEEAQTTTHRYTMSLFFMLTTMTSVGYGDNYPLNDIERQFACFVLMISAVAYAVIFGLMAVQIQEYDKTQVRYQSKVTAVTEFFTLHKLPPRLREKTQQYIDSLWALNRGIDHEAVLSELPPALRSEIMLRLHIDLVQRVPLFKRALQRGGAAFVKAVVLQLKPQVAIEGDFVSEAGSEATEMFFLHRGMVRFIKDGDVDNAITVGRGSFFGEEVLLTDATVQRRTKSVQAIMLCHLYVLGLDDFREVIKNYPEYLAQLKELATRRTEVADMRRRLKELALKNRGLSPKTKRTGSGRDVGGGASGGGAGDTERPRFATAEQEAVARELAYLTDSAEAGLAALIMQRGWRHFKHAQVHGQDATRDGMHRMSQRALFRKLYFAMKDRQIASNTITDINGRTNGGSMLTGEQLALVKASVSRLDVATENAVSLSAKLMAVDAAIKKLEHARLKRAQ